MSRRLVVTLNCNCSGSDLALALTCPTCGASSRGGKGGKGKKWIRPSEPVTGFATTYEQLVEHVERQHPDWDMRQIENYIKEHSGG